MKVSSHSGLHHMAGNFKARKHAETSPATSVAPDNSQSNPSGGITTVTSGAQLSFQNKLAASAIDQSAAIDVGNSSSNATNQETSIAPLKFDIEANF